MIELEMNIDSRNENIIPSHANCILKIEFFI